MQFQFENTQENEFEPQNNNRNKIRNEKKKPKKKRWVFVITSIVLALVLVVSFFGYQFFMRYRSLVDGLGSDNQSAITVDDLQKDPFALMLLGEGTNSVDGESGADSITLLVINPEQSVARIVSIPRDSYLPRGESCTYAKYYDKITNSGNNIACLQETLEDVFDVDINYYVSINFVSFVNIVNALGGVEMDVPDLRNGFENWRGSTSDGTYISPSSPLKDGTQWCEHDSNRNPYAVCFNTFGKQTVDGEHALALARSRHYDSDFARSRRQTELIKAIATKTIQNFNVFLINDLLSAAEGNIKTNIAENQFIDFAQLGQKMMANKAGFAMQSLQLDGESGTFEGDLGKASYNRVSIFSIEDIRQKIAQTLNPSAFPLVNVEAFYSDPSMSEFASKYGNYDSLGFLQSYMDVTNANFVKKYNTVRQRTDTQQSTSL